MTQRKRPASASERALEQPPEEKPRTDPDDPGEAVPPGDGAGKGAGRGVPAVLRRPAAGGSGAQQQLPPVEQWDPQAASLTQMEGMQPVTVSSVSVCPDVPIVTQGTAVSVESGSESSQH